MSHSPVLILLVAVFTMQVSGLATVTPHCRQKNKLLRALFPTNFKDAVFEKPTNMTQHCGAEWKVFGSCCDSSSLLQHVETEKEAISNSALKVNKEISRLVSFFVAFFERIDRAVDIGLKFSEKKIFDKVLNKDSQIIYARETFVKLHKSISRDNTVDQCWPKMIDLRRNALCSVCSGRSEVFFEANKLIIGKETCSGIISTCQPFFMMMINFFIGMEKIVDNTMKYYTQDDKRIWNELRTIKLITDKIKGLQLHQLINTYFDSKPSSPEASVIQKTLCESFVNVVEKTFIERLAGLLNYDPEFFQKLDQRLANKMGENPNRKKVTQKPNRLLSAQLSSNFDLSLTHTATFQAVENLFLTDVMVQTPVTANIDSSYAAYLGTIGSGLNEVSVKVASIPLNLTQYFP